MLSVLGSLIAMSVATNVFLWYGNRQQRDNAGGGNDAWNPPGERDGGGRRVLFRGRKKLHGLGGRRGGAANWHVGHRVDGSPHGRRRDSNPRHERRREREQTIVTDPMERGGGTSSSNLQEVVNAATENKLGKQSLHRRKDPDNVNPPMHSTRSKQHATTIHEIGERDNAGHGGQQRFLFRPYPSSKNRRFSEWNLTLPPPSSKSIVFNRLVSLDGDEINVLKRDVKSERLQRWLITHDQANNHTRNETKDDHWRSETVVWEHDEECVPMADWQTTFHVSHFASKFLPTSVASSN